MSLSYQHLFTSSPSRAAHHYCHYTVPNPPLKTPNRPRPIPSRHVAGPLSSRRSLSLPRPLPCYPPRVYPPDASAGPGSGADLDAFLSLAETLCVLSSAAVLFGYAVNCTFPGATRTVLGVVGSHCALAWGVAALAGGVAVGSWMRRRCGSSPSPALRFGPEWGREGLDFMRRVEKLEEDLKSTVTIVRVLSRQLEKLGIRFRVTRKSLKGPIAETAALAQKNSEATRALAVQEDILEQELREIQKVLLAMQEQQQKQLELVLAISKTGKLWETKQKIIREPELTQSSDLNQRANQLETHGNQASGASKGTNNDRP